MGTILEYVTDDMSDTIAEISVISLAGGALGGFMGPTFRDVMGIEETPNVEWETFGSDIMNGAIIGAAGGTVAQGLVRLPLLP